MKMRNEYIAPQVTVLDVGIGDIATDIFAVSSDGTDNWRDDIFGLVEGMSVLSRGQ